MSDSSVIGNYPQRHHRALAAIAHLSLVPSAFIAQGLGTWVLPLLWWWLVRSRSPLVDHHGQASVNSALSFSCLAGLLQWIAMRPQSNLASMIVLGIVCVVWIVRVIRRTIRAWQGRDISQLRFAWVG